MTVAVETINLGHMGPTSSLSNASLRLSPHSGEAGTFMAQHRDWQTSFGTVPFNHIQPEDRCISLEHVSPQSTSTKSSLGSELTSLHYCYSNYAHETTPELEIYRGTGSEVLLAGCCAVPSATIEQVPTRCNGVSLQMPLQSTVNRTAVPCHTDFQHVVPEITELSLDFFDLDADRLQMFSTRLHVM